MRQIIRLLPILLFISQVSLLGQDLDWNLTGAGARADGFGGAFIGVADDATALSWNPAGLTQLERPELSVVGRLVSNTQKWVYDGGKDRSPEVHNILNFTSFILPLKIGGRKIVLGAAYQRMLDFALTEEKQSYSAIATGGADALTTGLGVQLTNTISVGMSANIWFGESPFQYTDTDSPEDNFSDNYSFSGMNYLTGALLDFSRGASRLPLKIGVSLRTPFILKWVTRIDGRISTRRFVEFPLMYGVGASYRLGEFLTIAADAEIRLYGRSKIYSGTENSNDFIRLSDQSDDTPQFRVGAEYLLVTGLGVIPLRAGFRTIPRLENEYLESGDILSQAIGSGITLGSGLIVGRIALDVTLTLDEAAFLNEDGVDYTTTSNNISISGIFYF